MIEQIKKLRVQIDGLAQLTKELEPYSIINKELEIYKCKKCGKTFAIGCKCKEGCSMIPGNLIKEIKEYRIPYIEKKEINNTYNSLILAKAWLGQILGELGEKSPYKTGYKTKEDIEPTADVAKIQTGLTEPFNKIKPTSKIDTWELNGNPMTNYDSMNHIEKVDWLRTEIQRLIDTSPDFSNDYSKSTIEEIILEQRFVYKYLCEARFWLGFELQRIKENN